MAAIDIEKEFKHYLEIFTHDEELGKILAKVSFQELFNDKFLTENSKYTSMDDLIWQQRLRHHESAGGRTGEPG